MIWLESQPFNFLCGREMSPETRTTVFIVIRVCWDVWLVAGYVCMFLCNNIVGFVTFRAEEGRAAH